MKFTWLLIMQKESVKLHDSGLTQTETLRVTRLKFSFTAPHILILETEA